LAKRVTKDLESNNFNYSIESLYDFIWHEFADKYIEDVKNRINENSFLILNSSLFILLKLLHPFVPFITEEIYQRFKYGETIMTDSWPI
jgi:valyl-tRNA synthetase